MADAQLTPNAVKAIYGNQPCNQPVLQIVDVKKVVPNPGQQQQTNQADRYRLLVSDGINYQQGMLGTQQNALIKDGKISNNTVVRLTEYVCNTTANNRRIIIILNLEIVSQLPSLIGNPVNIENQMQGQALPPVAPFNNSQSNNNFNSQNNNQITNNNTNNNNRNSSQNVPRSQITYNRPLGSSEKGEPISKDRQNAEDLSRNDPQALTPVNSLNPYQNRWTIKVRVTFKGEIKKYSNDRTKDGKLFHFDVVDREKGEIRITMFNEIVDIFYPHIHKGNVYYISRGSLKFANKKFTSIKHEYELTLDRLSVLQQAADDGSIGGIDFSFTPISEMPGRNKDDIVDVIGVVMKAEARSEVTVQKQTQQERAVAKRNVTLIDTQGACIDLTLWGPHAENVDEDLINAHPVLAVKGAKVSDYNSRTLNCSGAAVLEWNPNLEEASQLRAWFDSNPSVTPSVNLSVSNRSGSGFTGFSKQNAPLKTFAQAKENQPDATEVYVTRATLVRIPHDNTVFYTACCNKDCNRRATAKPGGDGYTCPKCEDIPRCDLRYIISASAADHTGFCYLSAFNDAALVLLNGLPANELPSKESNLAAFDAVFTEAAFKKYRFTIRSKMETYNMESRLKHTIISVEPLNFLEESKRLLQEISQY